MKNIADIKVALKLFEKSAINHFNATEIGDYKTANSNYNTIQSVVIFLKTQSSLELLSEFFFHPSNGVKLWAATYLLPIFEKESCEILKTIALGSGLISLSAKTTLAEWKKGNLKI